MRSNSPMIWTQSPLKPASMRLISLLDVARRPRSHPSTASPFLPLAPLQTGSTSVLTGSPSFFSIRISLFRVLTPVAFVSAAHESLPRRSPRHTRELFSPLPAFDTRTTLGDIALRVWTPPSKHSALGVSLPPRFARCPRVHF